MTRANHPQLEMLPVAALTPNPDNARLYSDKQIAQLSANIERFGFLVPVIIDARNIVVAGNGRLEAARKIRLDEIPVIRANFLSEQERRAYALADNRLSELSEWDEDVLQSELEILFEGGLDITEIGFSTADLDFAIVEEEPELAANKAEEIVLPDPASDAVTQPGDLWVVGPHRLVCGSSLDTLVWEQLLEGSIADIVFADPPYNVPINGHVSGTGQHREFAFASGEMTAPEFTHFLRTMFRNCVRFSRDGSIHYHCIDWRHLREMHDAADGVYDQLKQLIVWNKGHGAMGTFYRSQHELVLVFKNGKARHINNFGLGETGRYRTNVVDYAGCNTFRKGREADLAAHSTVKPTPMVADFLLDCSNRGDLVVDPFLGSGTTLLAEHKTKRRGAAIEIDPLYVDTALARIKAMSDLEPVLDGDGRTFVEIAAERSNAKEA